MYSTAHINIMINVFGIMMSLAILLFLRTSGESSTRLNRLFIRPIVCNMAAMLFSLCYWSLHGPDREFLSRSLLFFGFASVNFLPALLADYVFALIERNTRTIRIISRAIYGAYIIWLIVWVISQFGDMFLVFDENYLYSGGEYIWVSQLYSALTMLVVTIAVVYYRKSISKNDVLYLLIYPVISIMAIIIQLLMREQVTIIYITNAFFTLFIYGGIQTQQAKLQKERELELNEARMSAMLSQIQPHFLYNSLAAIQRLCQTDPKLAEETVVEFTKYLRSNIDALSLKITIPFKKELEHTKSYLAIEKKRFGDKINIVYDITADDFFLPALTLQPIAENAVRYGITKREQGGTVTISTHGDETGVKLTVADDGMGFDINEVKNDGRTHIGIENVRRRLEAMCGGTLDVQSRPGAGTTVTITIPRRQ